MTDIDTVTRPHDTAASPAPPQRGRRRTNGQAIHRWSRWLHTYTSMLALITVLFFGLTGITLNHPTWTFGQDLRTSTHTAQLPTAPVDGSGAVDFLTISEHLRNDLDISGEVSDFGSVSDIEAYISYRKPGYSADATIDLTNGSVDVLVEQEGWVQVLNDLHKGRDTPGSWSWFIDVSAGFLVLVSVTGIVLQVFLKKRRRSAFIAIALGIAVTGFLGWLTVG